MTERTPLYRKQGGDEKHRAHSVGYEQNITAQLSKAGRSASIGALGGSANLGTFQFREQPNVKGLPRQYSVSADGSPSGLTPTQLGRQELYEQVPFTAVFGLQKKEQNISRAFASYVADVETSDFKDITPRERETRRSRASMIILDELEFEANVVSTPLVFAIIVACASHFLVGYNTGVMNIPEKAIFPKHGTASWAWAVAAFALGGLFGAAAGGVIADKRGRRGALLIDLWLFLLGGLLQTFAPGMIAIIAARLIIGFASGYSSVLVPMFLGELAPPTLRGMLGTLTQFSLVNGILMANLLAFEFGNRKSWRVLFAVTPVMTIFQLLMTPFVLESPRWMLNRDPDSLKARYIIKQLRGLRYDHEVDTEVAYFLMGGAAQRIVGQPTQLAVFKQLMRHNKIRSLFISCLILQMAQQLAGTNAVFYYSTSFFKGVVSNPLMGTIWVGVVNVGATYIAAALLLMDCFGRKTLILLSSAGMFYSCVAIILAFLKVFDETTALVAVNVYVAFFEIGLGPVPSLIVAEMFEAKYVAVTMSACSQLNWACNFVVALAFPYMQQHLGPYSFFPFAVILMCTFVFTMFVIPETQGTSPEELAADIGKRNSKSMIYQTKADSWGGMDEEWRKAMEQLLQEELAEKQGGAFIDYGFRPSHDDEEPIHF